MLILKTCSYEDQFCISNKHFKFKKNNRVIIESWLWEKEQTHRLFNFHEGYRVYEKYLEIIGSGLITSKGTQLNAYKASTYGEKIKTVYEDEDKYELKQVKVPYINNQYYVQDPQNKESDSSDNVIDNHLWYIAKFMPKQQIEIKQGDVIRFGRIPFKITKLYLNNNKTKPKENISINKSISQEDIYQQRSENPNITQLDQSVDQMLVNSHNFQQNAQQNHQRNQISRLQMNYSNLSRNTVNRSTVMQDQSEMSHYVGESALQLGNKNADNEEPYISFLKGVNQEGNGLRGGLKNNAKQVAKESGKACRICLEDTETVDNPFITPCKCSGSMRFIHLECLKEWLDSKRISQKLEGVYSYYWEELACELCKEQLKLNNESEKNHTQSYYLLNYKKPKNKKFMVLESDIDCLSKAIHVVVFSKKNEFEVGRRVNNDITVSDISVSRKQAQIYLKDDKVYLKDCDSKFGTFLKVQGLTPIKRNQMLPIQIEKKCFFFKLESRFSCLTQCLLNCGLVKIKDNYDHHVFANVIMNISTNQETIKDRICPAFKNSFEKGNYRLKLIQYDIDFTNNNQDQSQLEEEEIKQESIQDEEDKDDQNEQNNTQTNNETKIEKYNEEELKSDGNQNQLQLINEIDSQLQEQLQEQEHSEADFERDVNPNEIEELQSINNDSYSYNNEENKSDRFNKVMVFTNGQASTYQQPKSDSNRPVDFDMNSPQQNEQHKEENINLSQEKKKFNLTLGKDKNIRKSSQRNEIIDNIQESEN